MKNIWNQHKLSVIILGYAIAAGLVIYFLAVPIIKSLESSSDQLQEKSIDRGIELLRISQLEQMDRDWQDVGAKSDALDVILSSDSEVAFIESVELIAEKTGNIISLKIGESADPTEIARIKKANESKGSNEKGILDDISYSNYFPIQINLRGDYGGLLNFIHMLENSQFYVNIITIKAESEIFDAGSSQEANVFSDQSNSDNNPDGKDPVKKGIISTDINAIVYTKK